MSMFPSPLATFQPLLRPPTCNPVSRRVQSLLRSERPMNQQGRQVNKARDKLFKVVIRKEIVL